MAKMMIVLISVLASLACVRLLDSRVAAARSYPLPPNSRYAFDSSEFHFIAETNALGLRSRAVESKPRGTVRILVLGDSFTFGWGVGASDTWVAVLERQLKASGRMVEMINAGVPGAGPVEYARVARMVVPEVQPDIVLVGVLQGDDLQQAVPIADSRELPAAASFGQWIAPRFIASRFPAEPQTKAPLVSLDPALSSTWKTQALFRAAHLTPIEAERFAQIDPEVRRLYLSGGLNPALIYLAISRPDYLAMTIDPEAHAARSHILAMGAALRDIQKSASEVGATTIVLALPAGGYTSTAVMRAYRQEGFVVDDAWIAASAPDQAIREASALAALPMISITDGFRAAAHTSEREGRALFFHWDGHLTASGNAVLAALLADPLASLLSRTGGQ